MATILKVRRISNPRGRKRRLTDKQIRHFGTRAQKAALKRRRNGSRRRNVAKGFWNATGFHPLRRSADYDPDRAGDEYGARTDGAGFKAKKKAKARRRKNPALVVTLGANPRRKRKSMARRKRNSRRRTTSRVRVTRRRRRTARALNPRRRRRTARRSNRRKVYVARNPRRRRASVRRRRNGRRSYRRNPMGSLFGASITSKRGMTLIGGGIAGVVAAKFVPTMLPLNILGSLANSSFGKVLVTGGSAIIAGWAAQKFVGADFGEGVLFGGLMQTASVAVNQFFPSVYSQLGIGLGDLMPGQFVVPQNPIRGAIPPPAPPNARVTMNGLARAYGSAF